MALSDAAAYQALSACAGTADADGEPAPATEYRLRASILLDAVDPDAADGDDLAAIRRALWHGAAPACLVDTELMTALYPAGPQREQGHLPTALPPTLAQLVQCPALQRFAHLLAAPRQPPPPHEPRAPASSSPTHVPTPGDSGHGQVADPALFRAPSVPLPPLSAQPGATAGELPPPRPPFHPLPFSHPPARDEVAHPPHSAPALGPAWRA
eukprot:scaffold2887_cov76-Isochrysis_galbana.AAC.1